MSTTTLHPAFASSYERLARACARLGATLESPSGDGYVRRLTHQNKNVVFTAEALPLNSAASQALARDKIATYQLLEEAGLPIPRWFPFFGTRHLDVVTNVSQEYHIDNLASLLANKFPSFPQKTLIVKPGRSSGGNGVVRCTTLSDVQTAAKHSLEYSYSGVVQEYIEGTDYRVIFLDDRILTMTHDNQKMLVVDEVIPEDVYSLASHAQQTIGLRYGSIDLRKKTDGSLIILELNGNPGFDRLEKTAPSLVDTIMDRIVRAIIEPLTIKRELDTL